MVRTASGSDFSLGSLNNARICRTVDRQSPARSASASSLRRGVPREQLGHAPAQLARFAAPRGSARARASFNRFASPRVSRHRALVPAAPLQAVGVDRREPQLVVATRFMSVDGVSSPVRKSQPRLRPTEPRERLVVRPQMSVNSIRCKLDCKIADHESNVTCAFESEISSRPRIDRQKLVTRTTFTSRATKRPEGRPTSYATEIVDQIARTEAENPSTTKFYWNEFRPLTKRHASTVHRPLHGRRKTNLRVTTPVRRAGRHPRSPTESTPSPTETRGAPPSR